MSQPERYCAIQDCNLKTEHGRDLCPGHRKRLQRGRPVYGPLRETRLSRLEYLIEAGIALVEVDSENDQAWEQALDRMRRQAIAFAEELARSVQQGQQSPPTAEGHRTTNQGEEGQP